MKHTGSCLCGQYSFETELDPMHFIQCNCTKCRKLSGSYQIGCLYSVEEIQEKGDTALTHLKVEAVLLIQRTSAFTVMLVAKPTQKLKLLKEWLGSH